MSTGTPAQNDRLLALALSLRNNPRCYVALLGAGLSVASGIPSAGSIVDDLVRAVAKHEGETPQDPWAWYEQKHGQEPTYQGLLASLGPSSGDRQGLLKRYFQQTPQDDSESKKPGPAHRNLAVLARLGLVRIFVTTNFDLLIEHALRDAGLNPHTIATEADWRDAPPLDTLDAAVIHLHGEWQRPDTLRNTEDELGDYPQWTQNLLNLALQGRGVIIAGWSGNYDPALRDALQLNATGRYSTFWLDLHAPTGDAAGLVTALGGIFIDGDAGKRLDATVRTIDALATESAIVRGGPAISVARAKREIASGARPLETLDRLGNQDAGVAGLDALTTRLFDGADSNAWAKNRRTELFRACREAAALTMTLSAYAAEQESRRWIAHIRHLGHGVVAHSGSTVLISQQKLPGVILLAAAGVAAAAEERWSLVNTLLTGIKVPAIGEEDKPLATGTSLGYVTAGRTSFTHEHPEMAHGPTLLHDYLADVNREAGVLPASTFEEAWERWEYLWHLAATSQGGTLGGVPHLRVGGQAHDYTPVASRWLANLDPEDANAFTFLQDETVAETFDESIRQQADRTAWSTATGNALWYPSGYWRLDEMGSTAVPPKERETWQEFLTPHAAAPSTTGPAEGT
jgi:hypothetical protein